MLRCWFILLFFVSQHTLVGQVDKFNWSEPIKKTGQTVQLLALNSTDFIRVSTTKNQLLPATIASKYSEGKILLTKKIETNFDHKLFDLLTFVSFNSLLTGIYTDKSNGETTIYAVQFDDFLEPIGDPIALLTVADNNLYKGTPIFRVDVSDNHQFIAVEAISIAKKNGFDYLQYKVINNLFKIQQFGDFEFPTVTSKTVYHLSNVNDDGSFYFSYLVYNAPVSSLLSEQITVEKSVVVSCDKAQQQSVDLQMDSKKVIQYTCVQRDSLLFVTGMYGEGYTVGAKGTFYQRINTKTKCVEKVLFTEFSAEIRAEEQLKNRRNAMEHKEFSSENRDELYHYVLRTVIPTTTADLIVVTEQVIVTQLHYSDGRGMMQTVQHFNFGDVLTYKITADGNISWCTKTPKKQISTNDYGYFSSINVIEKSESLEILFNDDVSYYNDFDVFTAEKQQLEVFFPLAKRHACLAQTSIQFADGKQQRVVSCYAIESDGIIVPKFTVMDKKNGVRLFYSEDKYASIGTQYD